MPRSSPPEPDKDWLLDMRLYSASFSADRASMLLSDLGLTQQSLRQHLVERAKFLASRDRLERLKKLVSPDDNALDIDRKIIAVLAKANQSELFNVLISLFDAVPKGDLDAVPPTWDEMEKYGVQAGFWKLVASHFGYQDDAPTLKNLLIRLLVSDLDHACRAPLSDGMKHLRLSRQGVANAVVCLAQWRDSSTRGPSYEALSAAVATTVKLEQHLGSLEIEDLAEVKTFLPVEKAIASRLRDRVLETADAIKPEAIRDIASRRQDGYWAAPGLPDTRSAPRRALYAVYQALKAAADLFALRSEHAGTLSRPDAKTLLGGVHRPVYVASISFIGTSASPRTMRSPATGTSSSRCARRSRRSTAMASSPNWRWSGTSTWRLACSGCGESKGSPTSRRSLSGK